MSDAVDLDKCRANLIRIKTKLRNAEHTIADLQTRLAAAESDAERWMDVSVDGYPAEPCVVLIARGGKTVMGAFIAGRFWYRNEHVAVLFWRHLPKPPDPTDVHIDAARGGE